MAEIPTYPDETDADRRIGALHSAVAAAQAECEQLRGELGTSKMHLAGLEEINQRHAETNRKALDLLGIKYPGLCNDKVWGGGIVEGIEQLITERDSAQAQLARSRSVSAWAAQSRAIAKLTKERDEAVTLRDAFASGQDALNKRLVEIGEQYDNLLRRHGAEVAEQIAVFVGNSMDTDAPGDWRLLPRRIRAMEWKKTP